MVRRLLLVLFAFVVVGTVAFLALLYWPMGKRELTCSEAQPSCRVVRGRVIYALQKDRADPRRPLHLVLVSRDSLSAPAISVVKIPASIRPPDNPTVGSRVEVVGLPHRGSNGETSITADAVVVGDGHRDQVRPASDSAVPSSVR